MKQMATLNGIEYLKLFSPFILLFITLIVVPLVKRKYDSWKTFFELPTNKKVDALEYLSNPELGTNALKALTHKIKMRDYRLHEDLDLSRKIVSYYYEAGGKNVRFSRCLLKGQGLYKSVKGNISINSKMVWGAILFGLVGVMEILWGVNELYKNPQNIPDYTFCFALIFTGFFTLFIAVIVIYQAFFITLGKMAFNDYNPHKNS